MPPNYRLKLPARGRSEAESRLRPRAAAEPERWADVESAAVLPVSGTAVQMSNRQNHNLVPIELINRLVREPCYQDAPRSRVGVGCGFNLGLPLDVLDAGVDRIEQLRPEARTTGFVPPHGVRQFVRGGFADSDATLHR